MQIQILQPSQDGLHYPDYDELIRNASCEEERKCIIEAKESPVRSGFVFGLIYTAKMACGHYELFQHPVYRNYGEEPTEESTLESIDSMLTIIRQTKREGMKCTRCICHLLNSK